MTPTGSTVSGRKWMDGISAVKNVEYSVYALQPYGSNNAKQRFRSDQQKVVEKSFSQITGSLLSIQTA